MIKAGIIGATGYSGEALVRLIARHPEAEIAFVASRSEAGRPIGEAMPGLGDLPGGLVFCAADPSALAEAGADVVFLALPHGVAAGFARPLYDAGVRVIDLSADFRLGDPAVYASYYGVDHPDPELLAAAPYVLPELAARGWESSRLIACPGCYPTSVQLPLVPLLRAGLVEAEGIVINSVSGVSGAGRKATAFYSYCERENSVVAYGAPRHRHLSEIEEQLGAAAGRDVVVQFTPHLVPMPRGIATTVVARAAGSLTDAEEALRAAYADAPFVRVLLSGTFPDTRNVVHTNRCDLSIVHDERTGAFVLTSVIDNLLKGAGGQAVQICNRLFGLPETSGLL